MKNRRVPAFTLIEVLVSLTILAMALLAIFRGNLYNLRSTKESSDLLEGVMAAETILDEMLKKGFPESGIFEGSFEEDYFRGIRWRKEIGSLDIPYVEDLKLVTVKVEWGSGKSYTLQTVISRY